ncbi:hypothetical protein BIFGAL_02715 [Bifidobacterium gallicum DSM 20093 = LMG 11596]|uniref:Uncharacterized protein n=1 Tax=Bifidobacterium gallicum DSM 20093 = LMG 11596 TaxID=561180 RepID=D1NSF8_9BIFI|nr:hypothetical protein BIFGAL_02715 [Bifidobacterium gallicum DSM 20093 = LMG 11596]
MLDVTFQVFAVCFLACEDMCHTEHDRADGEGQQPDHVNADEMSHDQWFCSS